MQPCAIGVEVELQNFPLEEREGLKCCNPGCLEHELGSFVELSVIMIGYLCVYIVSLCIYV